MKFKKQIAAVLSAAMVVTSLVVPQNVGAAAPADNAARDAASNDVSPDTATGLVGYYDFDDSLANKAEGAATGATATVHPGAGRWNDEALGEATYADKGLKGKAYSFSASVKDADNNDAKGDGLELDVKMPETFTISYWVKPKAMNSYTSMVYSPVEGTASGLNIADNWGGATFPTARIWGIAGAANDAYLDYWYGDDGLDVASLCSRWTNVTLTCDENGALKMYIDGMTKRGSTGSTAAKAFKDKPVYLGINQWDPTFDGLMDEVRVYDRALTDKDVAALYEETLPRDVDTLAFGAQKYTMVVNENRNLAADLKYTPENAVPTFSWTSDKTDIVTVDDGMVKAIKAGTATIKAKSSNNVEATCQVEVVANEIKAETVTATADKTALLKKETAQVSYTYTPENITGAGTKKATYTSSDPDVLTVDNNGKVTAVGNGPATVTVAFDGQTSDVNFTVDGDPNSEFLTGAWWTAWTKGYELKDNSLNKFTIRVKGGKEVYNNFSAVFANTLTDGTKTPEKGDDYADYEEYGVLRADDMGWGTEISGGTQQGVSLVEIEHSSDNNEFLEVMKDATVDVTITRSKDKIVYTYKATNGTLKYDRVATFTHVESEPTYVFFVCDNSLVKVTKGAVTENVVLTPKKNATCQEEGNEAYWTMGNKKYKDGACTQEYTDNGWVLEKTDHNFGKAQITDATCTTPGKKVQKCKTKNCTEEKVEEIPALGHNMKKVAAVAPTATTPGNIEYYSCDRCNKCFSDDKGAKEITLESTKVAATGSNEASLTLSTENVTLYTGKDTNKVVVTANITGAVKTATWTSANPKIATVKDGTITAAGKGSTTITVQANGVTKTIKVTVKNPAIKVAQGKKSISKVSVKRKKSVKLKVTVSPSKSGVSLVKLSKKEKKIAKVTLKKGKLTIKGLKKGKLTVKIKSGKGQKKIKVTVK